MTRKSRHMLRFASGRAYLAFCPDIEREAVLRRLRERDVAGHELAHDPAALRRILGATRRRGFSVRASDFGSHYSKTRRQVDDGRNSIAMPVRTGDHVLGCVNLTWRRKALTLTEVVQRYAGDLHGAITTIENRLADAGVGLAVGAGTGPAGMAAAEPP